MSTRIKITVVIISPFGRYTASWPGLSWHSIPVAEVTATWSEGYRKLSDRWPLPREGESREAWAARYVAVHKWITQLTFEETILPVRVDPNDPRLRERPLPGTYKLVEGPVPSLEEHLELRHGESGMPWEHRIPSARIAQHGEFQFRIEFLLEADTPENTTLIDQTKRSAQFYLCDKCEKDPWGYARYHCNTYANFYASVQWAYFKKRKHLKETPAVSPPILLRSDGGRTQSAPAAALTPRCYTFVGPPLLKERSQRGPDCLQVRDFALLKAWLLAALPRASKQGQVCTTFVIDPDTRLWIADRRSEHVDCADGGEVMAAGEMTFSLSDLRVEAVEITNQSTGYCPEPDCWGIVASVLDHLGIPHPDSFTAEFHFRRCSHCQTITLIKDEVYECAVCNSQLPAAWNLAAIS